MTFSTEENQLKSTLISIFVALFLAAPAAFAQATFTTVQHIQGAKSSPTLKEWGKRERVRLGDNSAGYRANGPKDLCIAMKAVGLGCSYNERGELVQFLYVNGTDLFPCKAGTNPYTKNLCGKMGDHPDEDSFYNYIGRPVQNRMLRASLEKNLRLFKDGDLTATAAKKWQK